MSKEELVEKLAEVGINGEWIDADEYHDCLDYLECEECPYYYADLD